MRNEAEPDLLTRGGDLAGRLQEKSSAHIVLDATLRRVSAAASLTGEPLTLDDKDARAGVALAQDAATVRRLVEEATHARRPRDPLFVGAVGALIMFVAMVVVASAAAAFRLPALVTVPVILGGPLLGWALAVLGGERR